MKIPQQAAIHFIYDLRSVSTDVREIARDLEKQPFASVSNDLSMDTPIDVTFAIISVQTAATRLRRILDDLEFIQAEVADG